MLQGFGLSKNAAKIIAYLKDKDSASSRDIEIATGLRQPEVSIGIRTLRENGWIDESDDKNGKGRPRKIYSLQATIEEIIRHYETQKMQEAARNVEAIHKLREMISA